MSQEFTADHVIDDGWGPLQRLVQVAVDTRAGGVLESVRAESLMSQPGGADPPQDMVEPVPGELQAQIDAVQNALGQGPVLYHPPFGQMRPIGPWRTRQLHEHCVLSIKVPEGPVSLAAVLPASALTTAREAFRATMASKWHIDLIIQPPTSTFVWRSALQLAVILFTCPEGDGATRFFRYGPDADASELEEELRSLMKRGGGHSEHGFVHRGALSSENWSYDFYDPRLAREKAGLSAFGKVTTIGEVYTVLAAGPPAPSIDSTRVLNGRDIQPDGSIVPADPSERPAMRAGRAPSLQPGDIVISRFSRHSGLRVARVTAADLPAKAGHTLFVVREKAPLADIDREFVVTYLRSPAAVRQLRAAGARSRAGYFDFTPRSLERLPVPILDDDLRKAFADLDEGQRQMHEWARESRQVLAHMFDTATPEAARLAILDGGRLLRQRVDAGHLLEDLGYQIRTTYPYPIAYRWRTVEAMHSRRDTNGTIEATLACFEILLCYLSQAVLAMGHATGDQVQALAQIRNKVDSGRSGPSLGDWTQLLDEVATSRRYRAYERPHLFAEVRDMHSDHVRGAMKLLAERRNDEAHLRAGTTATNRRVVDDLVEALRTVLRAARFIADMPLLHVTGVAWDSLRQRATVEHRVLVADHPVVPFHTLETERMDIEKGSLYLADPAGRLHLLRPFLIGRECSECHTWSTFHLDRARGATLELKSLEHGHVLTTGDLRPVYEAVDHLSTR